MLPNLSSKCDQQRASSDASFTFRDAQLSLSSAARSGVSNAHTCLDEIGQRASAILEEHHNRSSRLEQLLSSFDNLNAARAQLDTVEKCRLVADAYAGVLHPLNLHMRDSSLADMQSIASNIEVLIEKVQAIRADGGVALCVDDPHTNAKVVASIEKRCVDAIVKSRAAFVNVLDNDFRKFGWPMNVPVPGQHDDVISSVKVYINQLNHLQRVASDGDYIALRTKWNRALSDNWAVAAILRAPLARFKYHFLEKFRVRSDENDNEVERQDGGTSRFDRPEWAAEFALERIQETTPFLSEIRIDGPHKADVKFAEGFCQVFAEKIAYDCELALRTSTNDSDADVLIAHASETAKQFDSTLRSGILSLKPQANESAVFKSSLHVLSMNESFLTTWASSELRLADAHVNSLLQSALGKRIGSGGDGQPTDIMDPPMESMQELEQICSEIVGHIGTASQKCRWLESGERISTFLKLTERPLLQALRSRLKEDIEVMEMDQLSADQLGRCGRAALCAQLISDALEDRSVDSFYVAQEQRLGRGFYDDEVSRLRALYVSTCSLVSDAVVGAFVDKVRSDYGYSTRFGEVWAPDAAMVLTHDLSESLVEPLTSLEKSLTAICRGVPCRRSASMIWRPVASKLDEFFFTEVVLQCFVGGTRNAMPAASEQNGYLTSDLCARMARQVAFDVETFVTAFSVVTGNASQFLPSSSECVSVLRIASNKVLMPKESGRVEEDEILDAIACVADAEETGSTDVKQRQQVWDNVEKILESRLNAVHVGARDALELVAIAGHRHAIRLA